MKTSKLFTIDTELEERLSNVDNAYALINELLSDYFKIRGDNKGVFDEKRAIVSDLKKKLRLLIKKLRYWRNSIPWAWTISALFGSKKYGSIDLLLKLQSKNIAEAEIYKSPVQILWMHGGL